MTEAQPYLTNCGMCGKVLRRDNQSGLCKPCRHRCPNCGEEKGYWSSKCWKCYNEPRLVPDSFCLDCGKKLDRFGAGGKTGRCRGCFAPHAFGTSPTGGKCFCRKCEQWKPEVEFFKVRKTGLYTSPCKICVLSKQRETKSTVRGFLMSKIQTTRPRARREGIEFTLTLEDLVEMWDRQGGRCAYTGRVLTHVPGDSKAGSPDNASLDRMDNSKGYTRENARLVSWKVNRSKQDLTIDEILAIANHLRPFASLYAAHPN